MRSSFGGLTIGISALFAQQRALDVTGHNISNVNTQGYTRQMVVHSSTLPNNVGRDGNNKLMQAGTGVGVQEIRQYRDIFLDQKLRREATNLGYWEARQTGIEELEAIFNDNTEEGFQSVMNQFWNSWSQLSKPSGGLTARALVKESTLAFVETAKNLDVMLTNFRKNRDNELRENIATVNNITKSVAKLNYDIKKIEASGAQANDYRDERDRLINELSRMANIQIIQDKTINIAIEGRLVVEDSRSEDLVAVPDQVNDGYSVIKWKRTMENIDISGGSIKSIIDTRDELVNGFREKLNQFVIGVASEVNKMHYEGYGNKDNVHRYMFVDVNDNTNANVNLSNISLNLELLDTNNIAAALSPTPGNYEDNRNSVRIFDLRLQDIFSNNSYETTTANRKFNSDEFYRNIISDLGLKGNEAITSAQAQKVLVEQIEYRRSALMSVSLDEEMSNLIKYEHSYNAAARIVNAMDEMLEVIVNKIGISGR
jgi:flagellar hook-associated protein 1 FlgK